MEHDAQSENQPHPQPKRSHRFVVVLFLVIVFTAGVLFAGVLFTRHVTYGPGPFVVTVKRIDPKWIELTVATKEEGVIDTLKLEVSPDCEIDDFETIFDRNDVQMPYGEVGFIDLTLLPGRVDFYLCDYKILLTKFEISCEKSGLPLPSEHEPPSDFLLVEP